MNHNGKRITYRDLSDEGLRMAVGELIKSGLLSESAVVVALESHVTAANDSMLRTAINWPEDVPWKSVQPIKGKKRGRPAGLKSKRRIIPAAVEVPTKAAKSLPSSLPKPLPKPKSSLTPEQLASRQLQGKYLGMVRRFKPEARTRYAALAKEKGRKAAIKQMKADIAAIGSGPAEG